MANPYYEEVTAGTSTETVTFPGNVGRVTIVPATADITVTFSPSDGSTNVKVPVGGFTFENLIARSVTLTRAVSTAVDVWGWG